jgi:hypothetical protein
VPIAALVHYKENEFPPLRVLVTYKSRLSDPRYRATSTFFVVHLLDESSEIRADAPSQVALDLYDYIEQGKTYIISGFGYRNYSKVTSDFWFNLRNDHALHLTKATIIEEVGPSMLSFLKLHLYLPVL